MEKSEFGEKASRAFSAYSVLGEGERNGVERKRSAPVAFSFKLFFAVPTFKLELHQVASSLGQKPHAV